MAQLVVRRARTTAAALAMLVGASVTASAAELWPSAVHARYSLKYEGISVGHIDFTSTVGAHSYALKSSGEVSLMFGLIKWVGASSVDGTYDGKAIAPKAYAFDWSKNKKGGTIRMAFTGQTATTVAVDPPPGGGPTVVPLNDSHKTGILDPLSAIMSLTKASASDPCDRRVAVFDGKQRFDIIWSYKRRTVIETSRGGPHPAIVCRAMYQPIAGYKNDVHAKEYAANRDAEVTLRRIAGTDLLIPHSVVIPTSWGTGTMIIDHVDVTSNVVGRVAVTP